MVQVQVLILKAYSSCLLTEIQIWRKLTKISSKESRAFWMMNFLMRILQEPCWDIFHQWIMFEERIKLEHSNSTHLLKRKTTKNTERIALMFLLKKSRKLSMKLFKIKLTTWIMYRSLFAHRKMIKMTS